MPKEMNQVNEENFNLTTKEAKKKLMTYIEEVERLNKKKKDLTTETNELFGAAKREGFDVKSMKEVIKLRKKDPQKIVIEEEFRELYKDVCIEL